MPTSVKQGSKVFEIKIAALASVIHNKGETFRTYLFYFSTERMTHYGYFQLLCYV